MMQQRHARFVRITHWLAALLLVYGAASLVHFVHNAELIRAYPGLPVSWTRGGVYLTWLAMTAVGVCAWLLLRRGFVRTGLLMLSVYALLGIDSLGHYVVAPFAAHTWTMNVTILMEVAAATFVLGLALKLMIERVRET